MMRLFGAVFLLLSGCVKHIDAYAPRQRDWAKAERINLENNTEPKPSIGSLFVDDGDDLFAYRRATRPGDLLTVRINEQSLADGEATTKLDRQSSYQAGVTAMMGLMNQLAVLDDRITPATLASATSTSKFKGAGSSDRTTSVQATIPAMVVGRSQAGLLRIEGHRVILVNQEEHHFYISGLVRRDDIDDGNEIASSRIAEAEMEFTGRGSVTNQARQGWLHGFLDVIWPF
jgi:flagellar L-ring protein precursor FlgH